MTPLLQEVGLLLFLKDIIIKRLKQNLKRNENFSHAGA